MKTIATPVIIAAVAVVSFAAGRLDRPLALVDGVPVSAQQVTDDSPPPMPPEMRAMLNYANPGDHHRVLDELIGRWSAEYTIRLAPDGPPLISRGTITRAWVLGGRFVKETVETGGDAGPFKGLGFIGFDNFDGQYDMAWMDDHSTAIKLETGTFHPAQKLMHVRSSQRDPVSGRLINTWSKLDVNDPDRHLLTGYATDADGHTFKALEGVLVRETPTTRSTPPAP